MIKSYTIVIDEIDDTEAACKQAADGIAAIPFLKNTMGMIVAHPEFVTSGIYEQIAKSLPFRSVGMTSISHCAGGVADSFIMSIMVLTSDDCAFSTALSGATSANDDTQTCARDCYESALSHLEKEPKLAILHAPFFDKPNVGDFVRALTAANDTLPVFGAIANDDKVADESLSGARVLYCGEIIKDKYALTLVSGEVDPKFYIASVTEDAVIMPNIGVITAADKNKILEINDINATQFLKDIGFMTNDPGLRDKGMLSSIFVLNQTGDDGCRSTLSRIPTKIDDDGVWCGGRIIVGAVLSIAFNTQESVLLTAEQLLTDIKARHSGGTVLINTCLGRRFGLLNEPMGELKLICKMLGDDFRYSAAYVNGELCPTGATEMCVKNEDHNQTIIACAF